jgi:hypothetical protein
VLVEHVKIVAVTLDAPQGRRHVEPCLHTTDQLVTQIENVQPRPRVMYAHNPSI